MPVRPWKLSFCSDNASNKQLTVIQDKGDALGTHRSKAGGWIASVHPVGHLFGSGAPTRHFGRRLAPLAQHRDRCPGSPLLLRAPNFAPPSSGAMPNAASHTPNVWPQWGCWAFARSEKPAADHAQRHAHRRASWLLRAGGRRPDPRKRSCQGNQRGSLASCGTLLTACSPPSPGRARARTVEPARPGLR